MTFGEAFRSVPNIQRPAAWISAERTLAPRLVKMIAEVPHTIYAEPFVGMGGVFFRRRSAPRKEVINDHSGEVVNLFWILQQHDPQFMDCHKKIQKNGSGRGTRTPDTRIMIPLL